MKRKVTDQMEKNSKELGDQPTEGKRRSGKGQGV